MDTYNEETNSRLINILNGKASEKEIEEFAEWVKEKDNKAYFSQMKKLWNLLSGPRITPEEFERQEKRFLNYIHHQKRQKRKFQFYKWSSIAAILIISIGISLYLHSNKPATPNTSSLKITQTILPGESKAILITATGQQVALAGENSQIVNTGQNSYAKTGEGKLIYTDTIGCEESIEYNRLSIPRGGEYTIVLSDGTEIKLNSQTSLTYPVTFGEKERIVTLSGEAFFQVKEDQNRPFYVKTDGVTIRVYGTSFNVNTHDDESIRTALVEGKIGIKGNGEEYYMHPSQLAEFSKTGELKSLKETDIYPYIAWKDGMFIFEDKSLEEIMDILSLWYNVDVFYTTEDIKNYHFTGHMQRYQQIDRILNAISRMVDVNFNITNRTIVISQS